MKEVTLYYTGANDISAMSGQPHEGGSVITLISNAMRIRKSSTTGIFVIGVSKLGEDRLAI